MHAKSLQSCPTLCDPMDSSPPGSSIQGILQARILENPMACIVHGVAKSRTQLSNFHFHFTFTFTVSSMRPFLFYLFIWVHQVLTAACGIYFPNMGSNLHPTRHWECEVLAIGPLGKFL